VTSGGGAAGHLLRVPAQRLHGGPTQSSRAVQIRRISEARTARHASVQHAAEGILEGMDGLGKGWSTDKQCDVELPHGVAQRVVATCDAGVRRTTARRRTVQPPQRVERAHDAREGVHLSPHHVHGMPGASVQELPGNMLQPQRVVSNGGERGHFGVLRQGVHHRHSTAGRGPARVRICAAREFSRFRWRRRRRRRGEARGGRTFDPEVALHPLVQQEPAAIHDKDKHGAINLGNPAGGGGRTGTDASR
jgi:hypothetical protein